MNVTEKLKFVLRWVENIVGKGENADYQHFLLFLQCYPKDSSSGQLKVVIVWERFKHRFSRSMAHIFELCSVKTELNASAMAPDKRE